MNRLLQRRIIQPFIDLLKQGTSPEKLALTIALGCVLGVTPVLGSTTALCTVAALTLGLNLPGIQLVNGLVYPLQLALLIPFLKAGAWLFRDGQMTLTLAQIAALIRANVWKAIAMLWIATVHALVVWVLFACACTAVLYLVLVPVLNGLRKQRVRHAETNAS